jgi:hypothetical protein
LVCLNKKKFCKERFILTKDLEKKHPHNIVECSGNS